jgi:Flp pilus assembly protein TadG
MLCQWRRDERGAIAPFFALALLPLMVLAFYAVDYSRASKLRTAAQGVTDVTALAALRSHPKHQAAHAAQATAARLSKAGVEDVTVTAKRHRDGRLESEASGRLAKPAAPVPPEVQPEIRTKTVVVPGGVRCANPVALPSNLAWNKMSRAEKERSRGAFRMSDGTWCRPGDLARTRPRVAG